MIHITLGVATEIEPKSGPAVRDHDPNPMAAAMASTTPLPANPVMSSRGVTAPGSSRAMITDDVMTATSRAPVAPAACHRGTRTRAAATNTANERKSLATGIPGLSQLRNGYDESLRTVRRKVRYDLLYVRKGCALLDAMILVDTGLLVMGLSGALGLRKVAVRTNPSSRPFAERVRVAA